MAYKRISGTVPQYSASATALASGYYLKGYEAGTTTALAMGTDETPTSTLAKCKLSSLGYPISNDADESTVFIPTFNQDYKLVLYSNSTDADNDTTANAIWVIDNLSVPNDYQNLFGDAVADTGGTRTLTRADFGRVNKFTHASAITLTIPDSEILEYDGPCIIWYPSDQTATITIDADSPATVEAESSYSPGAKIAIYRFGPNTFGVGGF